mmetsp:Transcript_22651/g.61318  ORF Transcript_22651/g.61318 Transcript_22651/m.61318 type:complete len:316 (+) Transcript_22651:755-1702(+)
MFSRSSTSWSMFASMDVRRARSTGPRCGLAPRDAATMCFTERHMSWSSVSESSSFSSSSWTFSILFSMRATCVFMRRAVSRSTRDTPWVRRSKTGVAERTSASTSFVRRSLTSWRHSSSARTSKGSAASSNTVATSARLTGPALGLAGGDMLRLRPLALGLCTAAVFAAPLLLARADAGDAPTAAPRAPPMRVGRADEICAMRKMRRWCAPSSSPECPLSAPRASARSIPPRTVLVLDESLAPSRLARRAASPSASPSPPREAEPGPRRTTTLVMNAASSGLSSCCTRRKSAVIMAFTCSRFTTSARSRIMMDEG